MPLYPPLQPHQIVEVERHIERIRAAQQDVTNLFLRHIGSEHDIDEFERDIANYRGVVDVLDRALFQTWGFIHRLRNSNVPITDPADRRRADPRGAEPQSQTRISPEDLMRTLKR